MSDYSTEASVTVNAIQGSMTGISALESGLVSINNQVQDIGRAITAQGNIMDTMIASVGVVAAVGAAKAAEAFGEVEQGMKIVQMVSQQTSTDIKYLTDQANQFSVRYRTDIDQITAGLQTLGRAGLNSAAEQSEVLENGLQTAKLEGRELNSVLEELIQNTALLGGDLKSNNFGEQTDYINNLLVSTSMSAPIDTHDVSETLKYSGGMLAAAGGDINTKEGKQLIEDYMGSVAAFAQKGVTGSIAGTALRAFFNKPATQDKSVLDGLSMIHLRPEYLWEDGGERMKPVSEQIGLIQGQMDKLNISTMDQMQIWSKIVGGKMGQQMMKLKSDDIKELTRDIQDSADAEDMATKSMQTYEGSVREMQETAALAFRDFGERVALWLGPIVKIVNMILKLFTNPVGSFVLFEGFLAILSKTVSIGIRYIRTFAADLKATLSGIQAMSNQATGSAAKAGAAASTTSSQIAESQKIKENNTQQAQQKEMVNKAAIKRTSMYEQIQNAEVKNEVLEGLQAIHSVAQRNIDETANNIRIKISAAIKSATSAISDAKNKASASTKDSKASSNGLTYLYYNEDGKLGKNASYNEKPNYAASTPKTLVEPPARVSLGYTKYNPNELPEGTAARATASKMALAEQQFEQKLAALQQREQQYIALNEIYSDPIRQKETIEALTKEKADMSQSLQRRRGRIIDWTAHLNNVQGAGFKDIYDKYNFDAKELTAGKNINNNFHATKIPILAGTENLNQPIIDVDALSSKNRNLFKALGNNVPRGKDIQRMIDGYMTAYKQGNFNAAGGYGSQITTLLKKEGVKTKHGPSIKRLINSLKLEADLQEPWEDYKKSLAYVQKSGGFDALKLKRENELLMASRHEDAIFDKNKEIGLREQHLKDYDKNLNSMLRTTTTGEGLRKSFIHQMNDEAQAAAQEADRLDAQRNRAVLSSVPGAQAQFGAQPLVEDEKSGIINTPTGQHKIDLKALDEQINKEKERSKELAANARIMKEMRPDLLEFKSSLRRQKQYGTHDKPPLTLDRLNAMKAIPSDAEIDEQIKKLQLSNNPLFLKTLNQIHEGKNKTQRQQDYYATHRFKRPKDITTPLTEAKRKKELYEAYGIEKMITKEREKQVVLTAKEASKRGTPPKGLKTEGFGSFGPSESNDSIFGKIKSALGFGTQPWKPSKEMEEVLSNNKKEEDQRNRERSNAAYALGKQGQDSFASKIKSGISDKFGGFGKAIKGSETLSKATGMLGKGFTSLLDFALNPVMIAITLITAAIDVVRGNFEAYGKELQDVTKSLTDQYKKRDEAESNLKQVFDSEVPDATAEQRDDYVLNLYNKLDENGADTKKFLKKLDMGVINPLPKYTENEDGTYSQAEEETATSTQSAAQSLNQIVATTAMINQQMSRYTSIAQNGMWGIDGLGSQISDGIGKTSDKVSSLFGDVTVNSSANNKDFLLTASQADDNYAGNTELAGLMLEDFRDARENGKDIFGEQLLTNKGVTVAGMNTFLGAEDTKTMNDNFANVMQTMQKYSDFASGMGRSSNLAAQMSMKQDKATWQKFAKEAAKEEVRQTRGKKGQDLKNARKNLKPNKRMEGLVNKLSRTVGKYLNKQSLYQLMQFQQLQDINEVAQATFVPLMQQQAQFGLSTAMASMGIKSNTGNAVSYEGSITGNTAASAAYLAIIAKTAAYEAAFYSAKENNLTDANSVEEFVGEANEDDPIKKDLHKGWQGFLHSDIGKQWKNIEPYSYNAVDERTKDKVGLSRQLIASAFAGMAVPTRYPNLTTQQQQDIINEYGKRALNSKWASGFQDLMNDLTKMEAKGLQPLIEGAYLSSNVGEDSDDSGGGGRGSGGGGSGGRGSGDKSDNTGTRRERVDLVLCNKKQIPKLDVNLFKKAPQFTILNKNFRLRDIKISTKDKPKAVLDSIKNAIIDTQQRMDPKIVQDEEAEYNPAEATDGKSLPAGSTKTKTK